MVIEKDLPKLVSEITCNGRIDPAGTTDFPNRFTTTDAPQRSRCLYFKLLCPCWNGNGEVLTFMDDGDDADQLELGETCRSDNTKSLTSITS
jgi:hypothetical protein